MGKKQPHKPFTENETKIFLENCKLHSIKINGQLANKDHRRAVWTDIVKKVNAVGGNGRTMESVSKHWGYLKSKAIKKSHA